MRRVLQVGIGCALMAMLANSCLAALNVISKTATLISPSSGSSYHRWDDVPLESSHTIAVSRDTKVGMEQGNWQFINGVGTTIFGDQSGTLTWNNGDDTTKTVSNGFLTGSTVFTTTGLRVGFAKTKWNGVVQIDSYNNFTIIP